MDPQINNCKISGITCAQFFKDYWYRLFLSIPYWRRNNMEWQDVCPCKPPPRNIDQKVENEILKDLQKLK